MSGPKAGVEVQWADSRREVLEWAASQCPPAIAIAGWCFGWLYIQVSHVEFDCCFSLQTWVSYNSVICILSDDLLLLHPFNGLFSSTTWVSRHQKGKPFSILLEQEMTGWQWHQLDICKLFAPCCRQITTPAPHHSVFTGRMSFLPPNQQCRSTDDLMRVITYYNSHTYLVSYVVNLWWYNKENAWYGDIVEENSRIFSVMQVC